MSRDRYYGGGYNLFHRETEAEREERFRELRRAASANLSGLSERNARERLKRELEAKRKREAIEQRKTERAERKALKEELKEVTKTCNYLDRKSRTKKGLTDDERAGWEEVDARRETLQHKLGLLP
jgi:hypothetical protein